MMAQIDNLRQECHQIEQDSLYTAQAHFWLAERGAKATWWWFYPAISVGGACGALVALGLPAWLGVLSALSGIIVGLAKLSGVDQLSGKHTHAANVLTALRHDARFASRMLSTALPPEQFLAEVRRLRDRYNLWVQVLPATTEEAFEHARARVKHGLLKPDPIGEATASTIELGNEAARTEVGTEKQEES
jgi:hypothetical protein